MFPEVTDRFENQLLIFLFRHQGESSLKDLKQEFAHTKRDEKNLIASLSELCARKVLNCKGKNNYRLPSSLNLVEAILTVNPKGFGFGTPENAPAKYSADIFIPPRFLGSSRHGDHVLLSVNQGSKGRYEGRIIGVLKRGMSKLPGIYTAGRQQGFVTPEDDRFPFKILVRREHSGGARNGEAVVVEILPSMEAQTNPHGRIVKVLGNPDDLDVQTDIVISKYELPAEFSEAAQKEAAAINTAVVPDPKRLDLRDIPHVTIDGETARDFDDAVAIVNIDRGFRLYVSIADVSHYVRPHSALDKDAYERGTSVYFPTRVVPMLPEKLSNNLCSLVPNQDRYAFSAVLDFDARGKLLAKKFGKSIIRSQHRLTYTLVRKIIVDQDPAARKAYKNIVPMLETMETLGRALENKRMKRGSIGFEIPEAFVQINDNQVTNIGRRERNQAHKIIEEFMLAANEAVAKTISDSGLDRKLQFLYRIHESPDPAKVRDFIDFAGSMGLQLPREDDYSPKWFGKVLSLVKDSPKEYIINNLLLRVMKQARYSPENEGHFGLAAGFYTHFTSPIRRYPDLMVHRALEKFLTPGQKTRTGSGINADEAGDFLSKRERVAVDAERDITDRLKVRFMADKTGEYFEGIISGVTSFGVFIELIDYFVSGAVPMTDITDDYYHFEEKKHRLIGKLSRNTYQIGDLVKVRLADVDFRRGQINFTELQKL